jgi:uncharacterized protein (TIGR03085 family)
MSWASRDRRVLADALDEVGPDAPTLCEGWTARDLAAHLVARERRPDSLPGIVVPGFATWTEKVRRRLAHRDFSDLVAAFRDGPPRWSFFALPGMDDGSNLSEHFVHAEDVLRARPGWTPRDLAPKHREALWRVVAKRGRMFYRSSPVGVVLVVPDGPRTQVRTGFPSIVITGQPEELLLHAFGRTRHALVEVTGPPDAVRAFNRTPLGV